MLLMKIKAEIMMKVFLLRDIYWTPVGAPALRLDKSNEPLSLSDSQKWIS